MQTTPRDTSHTAHSSPFLESPCLFLLGLFTYSLTLFDSSTSITLHPSGLSLNVPSSERPSLAKEDYLIIFYQNTSTTCNYFIYFIYISIPYLNSINARTLSVLATSVSLKPWFLLHACQINE